MFMYSLLILFAINYSSAVDLGPVLSGNRMGSAPLGVNFGSGEVDVENICSKPGFTCQDCKHAVSCVALPLGWLKVPLTECGEGYTCNAHLGKCSKETVPECDEKSQSFEYICEQIGIFPDPYDCRKFHFCTPPQDFPTGRPAEHRIALCPRHYAYDPAKAQCSIYLPSGQCEKRPIPDCKTLGEINAYENSAHHYYMCLFRKGELYPQIFLCPNGWYFSEGFCREEAPIITPKVGNEREEVEKEKIQNAPESDFGNSVYKFIFSTEPSTTFPEDNFLADKFNLNFLKAQEDDQHSFSYDSYEENFN